MKYKVGTTVTSVEFPEWGFGKIVDFHKYTKMPLVQFEQCINKHDGFGDGITKKRFKCGHCYYIPEIELVPVERETIIITSDGRTTTARLKEGKQTVKESKAVCNPSDTFNLNTGASLALNRLLYGTDYRPDEVAFKPTVREVKRPAQVGDCVKVINSISTPIFVGTIGIVEKIIGTRPIIRHKTVWFDWEDDGTERTTISSDSEYVVLENYVPEKQEEPKYWSGKAICVDNGLASEGVLTVGKVYAVKDGLMKQDNGLLAPHYESPVTGIDDMNAKCARHSEGKFIEYKGEN